MFREGDVLQINDQWREEWNQRNPFAGSQFLVKKVYPSEKSFVEVESITRGSYYSIPRDILEHVPEVVEQQRQEMIRIREELGV